MAQTTSIGVNEDKQREKKKKQYWVMRKLPKSFCIKQDGGLINVDCIDMNISDNVWLWLSMYCYLSHIYNWNSRVNN